MTFTLKARGDGDLKHRYRPQRLDELAPTAALTRLQRMAKEPKSQVYLFEGPSGTGKCLGLGTPVLMADGAVKPVEQVKAGDKLMDPDGELRSVLSTTTGRGPLFRIDPIKGEPWVCNDVHVMTLVHSNRGCVIDIPLNDYIRSSRNFKNLHKLFSVGVKSFDQEPAVPAVHPYFLGVWFGDGTKELVELAGGERKLASVAISKPDPEIRQLCTDVATQWNLGVNNTAKNTPDKCPTYQITGGQAGGRDNPLLTAIRTLVGSSLEVPDRIIRGSRETRLEFLAGFLDTDAELSCNCFFITQKREDWAKAVWRIARSLGFCATIKPRQSRDQNGTEGTYFVVAISGDVNRIPTRIPRKQAKPRRQKKVATRTGFAVTPIGDGDYYGFTLDGDGRFLLGDFTVTHNTSAARIIARASICEAQDDKPCMTCGPCRNMENSVDFIELNIADLRKIDDIREIIEGMRFMPMTLNRKIYIFDEVHQLTDSSQQVLLKTFEEPNPGLLIFMCTTQTKGLDKALLDRAEKVSFKSLTPEAAIEIVDQVVKAAGREVSKEIRGQLIDNCDGSARALLNNVQAYLDGGFDPETIVEEDGGADVKELALALVAGDWPKTADILKRPAVKAKPEGIRIAVESFVRAMVLNSNTINVRAVAALTTLVGTVSTEPGVSQYNRFVFKCVKACQSKA
jgi:DNA polymerase III delta prime subunit